MQRYTRLVMANVGEKPPPSRVKVGVVGWRGYTEKKHWLRMTRLLTSILSEHGLVAGTIVSGGAAGADAFGKAYAKATHIAYVEHAPDLAAHGGRFAPAALARNSKIVEESDCVVAFLHPDSRGTRDTIRKAKSAGKLLACFNEGDILA